MRRLVALYPRAWRDRYAAEFDDLLADRPATLRDQVDIARGAIDAWIHPQVVGHRVDAAKAGPGGRRTFGSATLIVGGGLLILAGVGMYSARVDPDLHYKLVDVPILVLILGMVLVAVAAIVRSIGMARGSGPATAASVVMLVGALGIALPWPLPLAGLFAFMGAAIAFGLILAIGDRQPVGVLVAIASLLMIGINTEDERALLTIPVALAWILVGVADLRPARRLGPAAVIERAGP